MTRFAAAVTHAPLWTGVSNTLRHLFAARPAQVTGMEALEREHDRIRLASRHWLMG